MNDELPTQQQPGPLTGPYLLVAPWALGADANLCRHLLTPDFYGFRPPLTIESCEHEFAQNNQEPGIVSQR
jgi:hypothetical protein